MKKRILFVDDEAMILQGLQRDVADHARPNGRWSSSKAARRPFRRLEQSPFDVIVSDMRMPRMNGAELLAEVMKRHPNTGAPDPAPVTPTRISFSNALVRPINTCPNPATPNPSRPPWLRASNLEGSAAKRSAQKPGLQDEPAAQHSDALHAGGGEGQPARHLSIEDIGAVIGRDIAMTAQVLKLVNSAFFGLPRRCSSAEEAVGYLGLDRTLKALVLSIHAFSQFEKAETGGTQSRGIVAPQPGSRRPGQTHFQKWKAWRPRQPRKPSPRVSCMTLEKS